MAVRVIGNDSPFLHPPVHDFGWKDLHAPTAKRFRCQLSAAINMAKFREDQLKLYAELNEPVSRFYCVTNVFGLV